MLPRENESYTALFAQMTRAMIRIALGHELRLKFGFTSTQKHCLDLLIKYLRQDAVQQGEDSGHDAVAAYHAFCWSLVCDTSSGSSQKSWGNPIERFIWLVALREDGSFMQASDLTPLLAKLKYFCRLVTLYESLVFYDKTNPREDAIQ